MKTKKNKSIRLMFFTPVIIPFIIAFVVLLFLTICHYLGIFSLFELLPWLKT